MTVTHPFQVETQTKVADLLCCRDIKSLPHHFVNCRADPKPQPYLQLRGRVRILIHLLVLSEVM